MIKGGIALFDAVAISGTAAQVRVARRSDASRTDAQLGRVSADGVRRSIAIRAAAPAVRRTEAAWLPWWMAP
jgi:hypothetical protein